VILPKETFGPADALSRNRQKPMVAICETWNQHIGFERQLPEMLNLHSGHQDALVSHLCSEHRTSMISGERSLNQVHLESFA
jgi:hypothetical protein